MPIHNRNDNISTKQKKTNKQLLQIVFWYAFNQRSAKYIQREKNSNKNWNCDQRTDTRKNSEKKSNKSLSTNLTHVYLSGDFKSEHISLESSDPGQETRHHKK